jgi:hypothetical protein
MAKDTRPQNAKQAAGKPAPAAEGTKKKTADTTTDGNVENRLLLEGVQQTQLFFQTVRELGPKIELSPEVHELLKRIETLLLAPSSGSPAAPAPAIPTPAPTTVDRTKLAVISGWREQLWIDEHSQKPRLRLPRSTIIGRCLFELGITKSTARSTIVDIFEFLAATAGHHAGTTVNKNVPLYRTSPDKKVRDGAGAALTQLFDTRLQWLIGKQAARQGVKARWLSDRGIGMFDGWPDLEVRDDAGWQCFGRHKPTTSASRP